MGRRMSNRDRIARMRAEADAAEKEKAERRAQQPPSTPKEAKQAAAAGVRMKVVWAVKDPHGEILTTYPYPNKAQAEAEAGRLREADGRSYIVTPEKVPMD
jgi:hypothetical protein